eukprot:3442894-Rhodomonas_salina.2
MLSPRELRVTPNLPPSLALLLPFPGLPGLYPLPPSKSATTPLVPQAGPRGPLHRAMLKSMLL